MESPSTPSFAEPLRLLPTGGLIALVAIGCASNTHDTPRSSPDGRGALVSQNLELLWSIEGRASACTLTRPTLLSDARRRMLARFRARSRAGALGYVLSREGDSPLPRVSSYVSCLTGGRDDAQQVTRVRFSRAIHESDRADLLDALPFEARWADEPCEGRCWPPRTIELVSPDTIEISMPLDLLTARGETDVRVLVTREIAERPSIVELTAIEIVGSGTTAVELLELAPRGVTLARGLRGEPGPDVQWEGFLAALGDNGLDPGGAGLRLRGSVAELFWPLPWALVEARIADEELATARTLRLALRERIVPIAEIDLDAPDALRRQAGARARAVTLSRDAEERRRWSRERAQLLERLFELTEDVVALGTAIGILGEIGEIESAHALARRAFELLPEEPNIREAFVASAPDLASAAAAVRSVRPDLGEREAAELSRAAVAARALGIGFHTVEESQRTRAAVAARPSAPTATEELPIDGLAEVAYLLLRASGESARTTSSIRLEGPLRPDAPRGHDTVALRWDDSEHAVWASVPTPSPTLQRLRWTSALLRAQLPEHGEVTLSAWLRDAAGVEHSISLRLTVRLARVTLAGASLRVAAAQWTALARDALRPVASLETTRFPLPVLRLALPTEVRAAVQTRVAAAGQLRAVRCSDEAGSLTCIAEDGPEALLELLVEVARLELRSHVGSEPRGAAAEPAE